MNGKKWFCRWLSFAEPDEVFCGKEDAYQWKAPESIRKQLVPVGNTLCNKQVVQVNDVKQIRYDGNADI